MGFAASQARLLLLTARKSDLEFRAQQITNSEMILAMQTEDVARVYAMKMGNQELRYIKAEDSSEHKFTASTLGAISAANGGKMKLKINGFDWVSNGTPVTTGYTGADGKTQFTIDQYNQKVAKRDGYKLLTGGDDKGKYQGADGDIITAEQYKLIDDDVNGCKPNIRMENETNDYSAAAILEGVKGGWMEIVYDNPEETPVDEINGTQFAVAYNTSDDAKADAEYRQKTAEIQVKEKRLQMDLTQVEAQQKACDTEIDSVKKIMDKNIERTFKVFS